ncbi:hypothetical protein APHAL10511_002733 [Amanita phalloides]|nr:hypothetical protein APHAL10511_002733 [Amanita phalloides]
MKVNPSACRCEFAINPPPLKSSVFANLVALAFVGAAAAANIAMPVVAREALPAEPAPVAEIDGLLGRGLLEKRVMVPPFCLSLQRRYWRVLR